MAKLGKKEKKELLRLASSNSLKKDLRSIKNSHIPEKQNVDSYLKFLALSNAFVNHRHKIFRKIQGHYFKI